MEAGRWPPEAITAANAQFSHHQHPHESSSYVYVSAPQPPSAQKDAAAKHAVYQPEYAVLAPQTTYEYLVHPDPSMRPPGIEYASAAGAVTANPSQVAAEAAYLVLCSYSQGSQKQQVLLPKESIRQYGLDPVVYASVVRSQGVGDSNAAAAAAWNQSYAAFSNTLPKKLIKKKSKVVQSAYCAVCKIDCNSKDTLDKHNAGKKHLKNIQKLEEAKEDPSKTIVPSTKNVVPPTIEKPNPKLAVVVDLETKRRKVLEGGAAAEEVRVCTLCDTVCNSQTVFKYHLAGKKHAAQLKKMAEAGAVSGV